MAEPFRMPQPGEGWRHYKGGCDSLYEVIDIAVHTETGEPLVLYRPYGATGFHDRPALFARPLGAFLAQVPNPKFDELRGWSDRHIPRFAFEREAEPRPGRHAALAQLAQEAERAP